MSGGSFKNSGKDPTQTNGRRRLSLLQKSCPLLKVEIPNSCQPLLKPHIWRSWNVRETKCTLTALSHVSCTKTTPLHQIFCLTRSNKLRGKNGVARTWRKNNPIKQVTYPICAWIHSPWEKNNRKATWLETWLATKPAVTAWGSCHSLTAETDACSRLKHATSACVWGRWREAEWRMKTEREGWLWPAACARCNRDKLVTWLKSAAPSSPSTLRRPLPPLRLQPVREDGDLHPHWVEGGSL